MSLGETVGGQLEYWRDSERWPTAFLVALLVMGAKFRWIQNLEFSGANLWLISR